MALFKCKMCGGDLEITTGVTIAECEYCGTKQTVPKATDENIQNLFNRANTLRLKSEFDKAEALYEKIIQADSTQADAYWGLILCKYGIEYVDDPVTFKKIPTCHRASYDSIIASDDYQAAMEHADMSQRGLYEVQAKEIDRIQKEILALAQKEETFDVFICYKETDADGKRTQDSVIANDIYYQLKQEGFKVFYAAITLEGKLGTAYEPVIFAALNSAKVMLAIGTRPEYFNAVWVKNEWSRFLKIIKNDRSKLLVPCYRDMDAYELPDEFAHLQAQDMSKIGFINDLVRGIKKVIKKDEPKATTVVKETIVSSANANVAPLLKRAFMFLEDGDWESADEYCEKVLDQDPENAQAYLGKLMVELRVETQDMLQILAEPFDDSNYYQKAMRFADDTLKTTLKSYIENINTRQETARLEDIYQRALKTMQNARLEAEYQAAADIFQSISEYKDAATLINQCNENAEIARKNSIFLEAWEKMETDNIYLCEEAVNLFASISGWKDADEKMIACQQKIEELRAQAEEEERLAEIAREEAKKRIKRLRKIGIILLSVFCVVCICFIIVAWVIIPSIKYDRAIALMDEERYLEAYQVFKEAGGYKDSKNKRSDIELMFHEQASEAYFAGDAQKAASIAQSIGLPIAKGYQFVADGDYETAVSYGLSDIVIPNGVTIIGALGLQGCTDVASVTIPNTCTSIEDRAFQGCTGLTSVTIPDSVTYIAPRAFSGCSSLTSVTIPNSVTLIGNYVFSGCSSLTSVTISSSVKTISIGMFYGCSSLTSITIPDSVTSIGEYAFSGCSSLTSITIPDSVTSIGLAAFSCCSSLTSITIPFVGASKDEISNTHFGWIFGAISDDYNDEYVPSSLKTVVITGGTSISDYAFYNCTGLTSIVIPYSVTSIGSDAFSDCDGLTSIVFPYSVTSIGSNAFYDCDGLTSIMIPSTVTSIGSGAFSNCTGLTSLTFKDPSTWYRTPYENQNKNGTYTSVTDAYTNATYFKYTYQQYYWYKK